MLEKVGFKNFLALRDVEIDLEPFTVIVGPNSSGKSTILEGINRICAIPNDNNAPLNRLTNEGSIVFDPKFFTSKTGTETEISLTFQDAFDEKREWTFKPSTGIQIIPAHSGVKFFTRSRLLKFSATEAARGSYTEALTPILETSGQRFAAICKTQTHLLGRSKPCAKLSLTSNAFA